MNTIEHRMKANPTLTLIYKKGKEERKMYWAKDKQQWEVYHIENRVPKWVYKGKDIDNALFCLEGEY